MMDNDFNAIKPVENLHGVAGLTPAGPRHERKRRQSPPRHGPQSRETAADQAAEEQPPEGRDDPHTIDYCA
ncbi:MAG: hypothetical protein FJ280_15045 [Planctomycetes bacterium]|nr:hypothetical protein [Planctomycetota bacterium]